MAMDFDPELLKQIVEIFSIELEEQLLVITGSILKLEKAPLEAERLTELDTIFRAAHNIKGAARAIDANDVADIAHRLESLFSYLKQENSMPSAEVIDVCLEAVDGVKLSMTAYVNEQAPDIDLAYLYQRLEQAIAGTLAADDTRAVAEKSGEASGSTAGSAPATESEQGDAVAVAASQKDASVADAGQHAEFSPDAAKQGEAVLRVAVEKIDQLIALGEDMQVSRIEIGQNASAVQQLNDEVLKLSEVMAPLKALLRDDGRSINRQQLRDSLNQLFETTHEIRDRCGKLQAGMRSSAGELGYVTSELNHSLFALRLVSASTLMQGMIRSVRDIARELGKKVDFKVIGDEIEIDRVVLGELKAPLLHLIRNAIDHGIEFPDERLQKGKPESGLISIILSRAGSEVSLSVSDDGHGIDVQQIAEAAVRKKLIGSDEWQHMDANALLELIFHPGFSTRKMITDISGRGVGLDVVRTALTHIKGRVTVHTRPGDGTSFRMLLPRMLATERGLLVRINGKIYVIPSMSIDRVMTIHPTDIVKVDCNEAVLIDGRAVPIHSLAHALGLNNGKALDYDNELSLIIIRQGVAAVAFLVDEVVQEQEIVIKSLMPPLTSVPNVMGAAVNASLGIMIVLNASDLLNSALSGGSGITFKEKERRAAVSQRILLVDDSITTRTLEKSVLENRGYATTLAVNGAQAWDILQHQPFDLIITDVEMPIMNGFELTTKIKADAALKAIPVIIVTSLANDADKRRGVEAGADAYIVKSQFESKALLALVEQLI
ncbi:MAG: hypothetical protein CO188_10220 [Zetaproteobacteria bacterium CG_4_9_14_3_um_filter_54_145]|nr:MAG: hypothetical protein COZ50_01375 [Zetaproteobacteria bacterium CG_4_10_14_3_um_filter_54_28]PJA28175.1 MAG: hypothetical protein CO188_10220 [Zetaproteobacteria bacterium CG_4_9_14_3_um_filter_54_145]